jgi:hypothetical protein
MVALKSAEWIKYMTEITHVRCDRCGKDTVLHLEFPIRDKLGWAHCIIQFQTLDFCPSCWQEILTLAKVKLNAE